MSLGFYELNEALKQTTFQVGIRKEYFPKNIKSYKLIDEFYEIVEVKALNRTDAAKEKVMN